MYNPRSGKWKTDEIIIKMQSQVSSNIYIYIYSILYICIIHVYSIYMYYTCIIIIHNTLFAGINFSDFTN